MDRPAFKYGLCFLFVLFCAACTDDPLKSAPIISSKKISLNKDRTLGVDFIYSDSAVVKAKGYAPVLDKVTEVTGAVYMEMPKGVKIDFFEQQILKGSIVSDYGIRREVDKTTVFKKNVVVTYPDGKYTCEELTWDENQKKYLSPSGIYTGTDGNVLNATNFVASQDFKRVSMNTATADIYTKPGQL